MKSAYEIAIEKMNAASGPSRKLTGDQKQRMAEIDKTYDAKIAEAKLSYDQKIAVATLPEQEELRQELTVDIGRFDEKRESEKEAVWDEPAE